MEYEPTYLGDIELNEETLAHYGVKGMRWRRRKNKADLLSSSKARRTGSNNVSVNYSENYYSNRPTARRRNVTGSGSGAYRKGSGLNKNFRTAGGQVGNRSSATRSPGMAVGYSQVTGGGGNAGLHVGGVSQVTRKNKKQQKKRG